MQGHITIWMIKKCSEYEKSTICVIHRSSTVPFTLQFAAFAGLLLHKPATTKGYGGGFFLNLSVLFFGFDSRTCGD